MVALLKENSDAYERIRKENKNNDVQHTRKSISTKKNARTKKKASVKDK